MVTLRIRVGNLRIRVGNLRIRVVNLPTYRMSKSLARGECNQPALNPNP